MLDFDDGAYFYHEWRNAPVLLFKLEPPKAERFLHKRGATQCAYTGNPLHYKDGLIIVIAPHFPVCFVSPLIPASSPDDLLGTLERDFRKWQQSKGRLEASPWASLG